MDKDELAKNVLRKGFYEVAEYFRKLFEEERINHKVPVKINDRPMESLFFAECDITGVPKRMYYEFLTFNSPLKVFIEKQDLIVDNISVRRKAIQIERPILQTQLNWDMPYQVFYFLWEGRILDDIELDLADLDVKYLQQLSQEAIKKREPIILDEVIKNKLIK